MRALERRRASGGKALSVGAVVLLLAAAADATLLGIEWHGNVWNVEVPAGTATLLGNTGFDRQNALAIDSLGRVFTVSGSDSGGQGALLRVNRWTGEGGFVTSLDDADLAGARGLAFSPDDVLYGVYNERTFGPSTLFTIDTTTGALDLVGRTGLDGIQSLNFAPDGTLYAWDVHEGLHSLDLLDGSASSIGGEPTTEIQNLGWVDGMLYGGKDALFSIDPYTGETIVAGNPGFTDLRGLVLLSVPEPGTALLLASGLAALAVRRRRFPARGASH